MLCEECKKREATTHVKTNINGHITEQHLCHECAEKKGIAKDFSFNNPLADMLTSIFGSTAEHQKPLSAKHCSCCNSTLADIMNSGKLGCSECYDSFYEDLLPYFNRIHGGIKHIGKIAYTVENNDDKPAEKAEEEKHEKGETVETLKAELEKLIKEEKFEQAAVVRDKIKALEEKNK